MASLAVPPSKPPTNLPGPHPSKRRNTQSPASARRAKKRKSNRNPPRTVPSTPRISSPPLEFASCSAVEDTFAAEVTFASEESFAEDGTPVAEGTPAQVGYTSKGISKFGTVGFASSPFRPQTAATFAADRAISLYKRQLLWQSAMRAAMANPGHSPGFQQPSRKLSGVQKSEKQRTRLCLENASMLTVGDAMAKCKSLPREEVGACWLGKPSTPVTLGEVSYMPLHLAAVANGLGPCLLLVGSKSQKVGVEEHGKGVLVVSHLCGNSHCFKPTHVAIEAASVWKDRVSCKGTICLPQGPDVYTCSHGMQPGSSGHECMVRQFFCPVSGVILCSNSFVY